MLLKLKSIILCEQWIRKPIENVLWLIFLSVYSANPAIQQANKAAYKLSDIMKYA